MVDCAFVAADRPIQCVAAHRSCHPKAVVDARFNLGAFFIVVPSHELEPGKLVGGGPQAVCLIESGKPGLTALLLHVPVCAPACQRVIESFVARSYRQLLGILLRCLIEVCQITEAHRISGGHVAGLDP